MTKNSTEVAYIYVLIDPNSNLVRYVGQSVDPLTRYQRHTANNPVDANPYKYRWIEKLKRQGQQPELKVIECCAFEKVNARECFWIEHYKNISGKKLTNRAEGGNKPDLTIPMIYKQARLRQGTYKRQELKACPYVGVSWSKDKNQWNASISHSRKKINICYRDDPKEAAFYYDAVALHIYGPNANTNGLTNKALSPKEVNSLNLKYRIEREKTNSGFLGVTHNKNMWVIRVKDTSGKRIEVGRTKSKILAARVYDACTRYFNSESLTNFPGISKLSVESANKFCKQLTKNKASSKYRGISINKRKEFVGIFSFNKSSFTICCCKNEEDAVYIYDAVARFYGKPPNFSGTVKMSIEEARKYSSELKRQQRRKAA